MWYLFLKMYRVKNRNSLRHFWLIRLKSVVFNWLTSVYCLAFSFFYFYFFFFFKQMTAYEILTCDWSSDVCSSDLLSASERREDGQAVVGLADSRSGAAIGLAAFCQREHASDVPASRDDVRQRPTKESAHRSEERRGGKGVSCGGYAHHEQNNYLIEISP